MCRGLLARKGASLEMLRKASTKQLVASRGRGGSNPPPGAFLLEICVYFADFKQEACLNIAFCFAFLLYFTFRFKFTALSISAR
jgi:hypothetical protein